MKKYKHIFEMFFIIIILLFSHIAVGEVCVGNGGSVYIKENTTACILVGQGNKVINCVVSGLMQSANVLITSSGFSSNSVYSIPTSAVPITYNTQRITFSGYGSPGAKINFQYYGPWDPSYSYELTCTW